MTLDTTATPGPAGCPRGLPDRGRRGRGDKPRGWPGNWPGGWAAAVLAVARLFILVPCACFLVLAISPRLFDQGAQWFTLSYLRQTFTGATAVAIGNSLWVSGAAAALGLAIGFPIAWLANRTTLPGRRLVAGSMWLVLLLPSWLPALGWERLVQPDGVMYRLGLNCPSSPTRSWGRSASCCCSACAAVPFTYLAITAALAGLGQEFEDAARVHGASRVGALRLIVPMLAPAIWSALAIGFAESISDFGVAATLAYNSNFPLGDLPAVRRDRQLPAQLPAGLRHGRLLVAAVAIPLALQARALRGRSYALLSGRSRAGRPTSAHPAGHGGRDGRRRAVLPRRARGARLRRRQRVAARQTTAAPSS